MNIQSVFSVSAAGMEVERMRIEVAALNLANANLAHAPGQTPFQPLKVVSTIQGSFFQLVDLGLSEAAVLPAELRPMPVVVPMGVGPRQVHEPGHPFANEAGFVNYANVDIAAEMMTLMISSRAYEANVAALNTTRNLAIKTLEIGGGNA